MSASLAEDFALLLADLRRMEYNNDDPMRHSKRRAKTEALRILQDAVACARNVAELPGLIAFDHQEAVKSNTPP